MQISITHNICSFILNGQHKTADYLLYSGGPKEYYTYVLQLKGMIHKPAIKAYVSLKATAMNETVEEYLNNANIYFKVPTEKSQEVFRYEQMRIEV